MKLSRFQMQDLVTHIFSEWKKQGLVIFKEDESKVYDRAMTALRDHQNDIQNFENEVRKMVDDLERKTPGGFDRHKMYLLVRQRLAKEKKVIL